MEKSSSEMMAEIKSMVSVRAWGSRNGRPDFHRVWSQIYDGMEYYFDIDVRKEARKRGVSGIRAVEEMGIGVIMLMHALTETLLFFPENGRITDPRR